MISVECSWKEEGGREEEKEGERGEGERARDGNEGGEREEE